MKLTSSRTVLGLASVALIVGAMACGGDDDDTSSATTTTVAAAGAAPTTAAAAETTEAQTTEAPSTTPAAGGGLYGETPTTAASPTTAAGGGAAAAGGVVALADTSLGKVLVDGSGLTLYMFVPDNQGPSTCTGQCLAAWPALYGPVTAGEGIDASKLGTATRPDDGKAQATYGGWPLYTFIQDAAPGDVNGQDSGQKWYVIGADGTPIMDAG